MHSFFPRTDEPGHIYAPAYICSYIYAYMHIRIYIRIYMLPKFAVHALVLGTSSVAASYAVPALVHTSRATVVKGLRRPSPRPRKTERPRESNFSSGLTFPPYRPLWSWPVLGNRYRSNVTPYQSCYRCNPIDPSLAQSSSATFHRSGNSDPLGKTATSAKLRKRCTQTPSKKWQRRP